MSQQSSTNNIYPLQLTDSVRFLDHQEVDSSTRSNFAQRGMSTPSQGIHRPRDQDNPLNQPSDVEDNFTVENALFETYGSGMYQIKSQIVGVFSYCLHSQYLDLMPFLQLYPALQCANEFGKYVACSRETACQNPFGYEVDWNFAESLHNWTTELDLVCIDPAKIGVMGTIAFISTAIGSIIFGGLIDTYGRRKVLLWSMIVTPLVQIMWLVHPNLLTIYFGLFWLGLVSSVRYSAAYVFTTESLLSQAKKLQFCVYQFMADGLLVSCFSFVYWAGLMTWRKQMILYSFANILLFLFTYCSLKESPAYLYSKGNFAELEGCFEAISKSNGTYSRPKLEQLIKKLHANKQREEQLAGANVGATNPNTYSNLTVMCRSPVLRNNLFAMCCIWSVSSSCFYLIDFYVKYFPGSVFVNKAVFGICDALSVNYAQQLDKRVRVVPYIIRICLIGATVFSIMYMTLAKQYMVLIPILIGLCRIQVNAILAYAYHVNQYLFPVLMRGAAYSVTGFVSRPVIGFAVFLTEYISNPMLLVATFCMLNVGVTFMIKEPIEEELPTGDRCAASELSDASSSQAGKEPPFNASIRSSLLMTESGRDVTAGLDTLKRKRYTPQPFVLWRQSSMRPRDTALSTDAAADLYSAGQEQQEMILDRREQVVLQDRQATYYEL